MHYVVVGAGYTGRRVLSRLPSGRRIAVGRRPVAVDDTDMRLVDLDGGTLSGLSLPPPYRVLYTVPPPPAGTADERLARLLGALAIAPERFVYLSTTGVYGDRRGATVRETDAPSPTTGRARRRLAAETLLADRCAHTGTACLVLRVPGIYGPGRLGLDRLRGAAEVLRDVDAGPGNRIHIDDLAACALAALTGDAPGGIYNVGDGDHRSASEFSRVVARLAGLPAPAAISLEEASARWGDMRLSFARESRTVETEKMRRVLGVTPRYQRMEDGIRASLDAG